MVILQISMYIEKFIYQNVKNYPIVGVFCNISYNIL